MEKLLRDASFITPDPERAYKNLSSFIEENPGYKDRLEANLTPISLLFSSSQFLSNFSVSNPEVLFNVLDAIDEPLDKEMLSGSLGNLLASERDTAKTVRRFKRKELLKITLKDILKKTDITESMIELSILADVIVDESLRVLQRTLNETYGEPKDNGFSVIALGKLGSEELNFSSDIDLIFAYGKDEGETSGIRTPQGVNVNRISCHEYYCKFGEHLNRLLSMNTEDGFAYRVDLRLRPEGQRGSLALSLAGYETYYESWGRAWERAMLLRARPIAGDADIGKKFLETIKPFVYRKYLDFSAIDEIKHVKTRIDSVFKKNDIKRGYGGIREIEFFIHALQLIYAGKDILLRERSTLKALHKFLQKNIIGHDDYSALLDNYKYLRILEHRLQQLNDLQTHSLPSDESELIAISRKMGFKGKESFLADLESRRKKVRAIYDSLFKGDREEQSEGGILFDEELSDTELKEYLSGAGLRDADRSMRNIQNIRDVVYHFQTLRGRRILSEILPLFADAAIRSSNPDMALNHLQSFASLLSTNESYIEMFKDNKDLIPLLMSLFSQSEYLSKTIIRRPDYLELGQEMVLKRSLAEISGSLRESTKGGQSVNDAIRIMRQKEELRLGMLFLRKNIKAEDLIKGLSKTAEAVLSTCLDQLMPSDGAEGFLRGNLAIIGFGKLGGREITFSSDLDIIFAVMSDDVSTEQTKAAERLLRLITSYTREGIAYRVDMRLRPDGTKGPLVSSINSFKDYYSKNAAFWEFQALLKARPVAGDVKTGQCFIDMAKDILIKHGSLISASDVRAMRSRIQKELSKETEGRDRLAASYDIKLGRGGLEELEFTVQYLQLKNCNKYPSLLVQGTLDAIGRLEQSGIIKGSDADIMKKAYVFYRTVESYMRLREKDVLKKSDVDTLSAVTEFLGFKDGEELIENLDETRAEIRSIYDTLVV